MADELTKPAAFTSVLQFGGGLNTTQPEDQINEKEAADGKNFDIDIVEGELRARQGFDKLDTAPNGSRVNGGISLLKSDGTVQMAIQAGDTVYEFDGSVFGAVLGIVNTASRLRGRLEHNFDLTDTVLITDLALVEPVKEWDGTTFQTMTENLTGDFKAKYCHVDNERALFANVESNSVATPHVVVGSQRGDNEVLTVTNRPSSSLSEEDPFFLPMPDLSPIRGFVGAFGQVVIATTKNTEILSGESAKDFSMTRLGNRIKVSGDEALIAVGDDIVFGRQGKIESVKDTDRFGDVSTNDLSLPVRDNVKTFNDWTAVYNSRTDRAFFFPEDEAEVWVLEKSLMDSGVSPWIRWDTNHESSFNPTFVMNMLDPSDGLEYIYFGDASGNLYKLEGSEDGDDGIEIPVEYLSKLISVPVDLQMYSHEGEIRYRNNETTDVNLTYEFTGLEQFNSAVTINITGITNRTVYNDSNYYNDNEYYGTAGENKLVRQKFEPSGQANEFQIRISYEETTAPAINAIIQRFEAING